MTSLKAANGNVYAVAQGPLTLGGYRAGNSANAKVVNHLTVGRIPEGGVVEQDASIQLAKLDTLSLLLRDPDFAAARDVAAAINKEFGSQMARAIDSRRIEIASPNSIAGGVPALMARVDDLEIQVHPVPKSW